MTLTPTLAAFEIKQTGLCLQEKEKKHYPRGTDEEKLVRAPVDIEELIGFRNHGVSSGSRNIVHFDGMVIAAVPQQGVILHDLQEIHCKQMKK